MNVKPLITCRLTEVPFVFAFATALICCFQPGAISEEAGENAFRSAFPLDALKNVAKSDAQVAANILIKRIIEAEGYQYQTSTPEDHAEFIPQMLGGNYDMFLMFSYEYIRQRENYGISPQVIGSYAGNDPRQSLLLLTHADSSLDSIEDGSLVIQSGTGELARIWLEEELARKSKTVESVFGDITLGANVGKAALPVFFKKTDACIVTEQSFRLLRELNPQVGVRLRTEAKSEPLVTSVICLRADYKEIRKGQMREVGVKLHNTPDGSQLLTMMGVERLVPFDPTLLSGVENLLNSREERLRKEGSAPESITAESAPAADKPGSIAAQFPEASEDE